MVEEKKKAGYVLIGSAIGSTIVTLLAKAQGFTEPTLYVYCAAAGSIAGGLATLVLLS